MVSTGARGLRQRPIVRVAGPQAAQIAQIAGAVPDPELPMLSLANLGVLRAVEVEASTGAVTVTITPTYIGCPAMDTMAEDIVTRLAQAGFPDVTVRKVLGGDWSSDDVSAAGRRALTEAGIASPAPAGEPETAPACPLCGSASTEMLSRFGATSCKALWRCLDCREPFEYFKAH